MMHFVNPFCESFSAIFTFCIKFIRNRIFRTSPAENKRYAEMKFEPKNVRCSDLNIILPNSFDGGTQGTALRITVRFADFLCYKAIPQSIKNNAAEYIL